MSVSRFAGQAVRDFRGISLPSITDFMPGKEDYGKTVSQGIAERGATDATSLTAQAREIAAGIGAKSAVKQAKYGGSAAIAQGSARGRAATFGGIASGVGSLASGYMGGLKYGQGPNPRPAMNTAIPGVNDNPFSTPSPIVDSTYGISTPISSGVIA